MDNAMTDLPVKFGVQLLFEQNDLFKARAVLKGKMQVYPYRISDSVRLYGMDLFVPVLKADQDVQHLDLQLFGKRFVRQLIQ